MRVYLDACLLIYLHEGDLAQRRRLRERLMPPGGQQVVPCVSELTRLECRVRPLREDDSALLAAYDRFFALPVVEFVPLGRPAYDCAALLRAHHGLRTPDALHLGAAIEAGCTSFWTNDRRLVRPDLGIEVSLVG